MSSCPIETVRRWCAKFGCQAYANRLRRRRARPGDKWHLEVILTINGRRQYLWRAVDQDGIVLDVLVQSRRNAEAATRFFRKLLKGAAVRAAGADHRQVGQLPDRAPRAHAVGRASPLEVPQQPGGELPSADPTAGAGDATVHITSARTAVPIRVRRHLLDPAGMGSPPATPDR